VKKYSRVYLSKGEKHFGIRYNYTDAMLEYVSRWDCEFIDGELVDVILDDWQVADCIGLSRDEWKEDPEYWVETYRAELDEEAAELAKYI